MLVKDFVEEYRRYRMLGEKAIAQMSDDAITFPFPKGILPRC